MSETARRAYTLRLEAYKVHTDRMNDITGRVAAAAAELQEWPSLAIEGQHRRPVVVPQDRLRTVRYWASPAFVSAALVDWDTSRLAVCEAWNQLAQDDRDRVEPPWDPFSD